MKRCYFKLLIRKPTQEELRELREVAEFQFDVSGELLIPNTILVVVSPNTNRIRLILHEGRKYLGLRSRDYRFNLYLSAGYVLNKIIPHPRLRVYVKEDYVDFIAKGGNLFCKHVLMADPNIRPGDEILVVDPRGELIAVGRARISGWELVYYNRGEGVRIREGVSSCRNSFR